MPAKKSLLDKLYYNSERTYDVRRGDVLYLDDAPLKQHVVMGGPRRAFVIVLLVVAAIIGGVFINNLIISPALEAQNAQAAMESNLLREPSIETIPIMTDVIQMSDEEILASFDESGYVYYDMTEANGGTLTLFKLPADVTPEDGEALLVRGIDALTAEQASRLLQGAWYFSADRVGGTSMVVRYADFSTGTPEVALQSALAKEGFDPESQSDAGVDDSGNAYITGNIEVAGWPATWRISALPLSDVYDIQGLPEDAVYVGVRITW